MTSKTYNDSNSPRADQPQYEPPQMVTLSHEAILEELGPAMAIYPGGGGGIGGLGG